jgi:hypothetical protein
MWLDLPPARKLVLVALCDRANGTTGQCWPGRKEIAVRASLSERRVTDHLRGLEADGWIRSGAHPRYPGQTTTRWVAVEKVNRTASERRDRLQAQWRGQDDSSHPLINAGGGDVPSEEGTLVTGGGDVPFNVTVIEPSSLTVIEEETQRITPSKKLESYAHAHEATA